MLLCQYFRGSGWPICWWEWSIEVIQYYCVASSQHKRERSRERERLSSFSSSFRIKGSLHSPGCSGTHNQTMLASVSQGSDFLCLPNAGIKGIYYHTQLLLSLILIACVNVYLHAYNVYVYTCVFLSNLLSSYNVTCMHVFRAHYLAVINQLVCSSLGKPNSLVSRLLQLPIVPIVV